MTKKQGDWIIMRSWQYKNIKYQELKSNYKEMTHFEGLRCKYNYREEKFKTNVEEYEVLP